MSCRKRVDYTPLLKAKEDPVMRQFCDKTPTQDGEF